MKKIILYSSVLCLIIVGLQACSQNRNGTEEDTNTSAEDPTDKNDNNPMIRDSTRAKDSLP